MVNIMKSNWKGTTDRLSDTTARKATAAYLQALTEPSSIVVTDVNNNITSSPHVSHADLISYLPLIEDNAKLIKGTSTYSGTTITNQNLKMLQSGANPDATFPSVKAALDSLAAQIYLLQENTESTYSPAVADSVVTSTTIGGIPANTAAVTLKSKTFSQMWDEVLFPVTAPTITPPSVSLSNSGNWQGSKHVYGQTVNITPNVNLTNGVPHEGSVQNASLTIIAPGGSATVYNPTSGTIDFTNVHPITIGSILAGTYFVNLSVTFAEGTDTALDSHGNETSPPTVQAGVTLTQQKKIYGVYNFYERAWSSGNPAVFAIHGTKQLITDSGFILSCNFSENDTGAPRHAFAMAKTSYQNNTWTLQQKDFNNNWANFATTYGTYETTLDGVLCTVIEREGPRVGAADYKFIRN